MGPGTQADALASTDTEKHRVGLGCCCSCWSRSPEDCQRQAKLARGGFNGAHPAGSPGTESAHASRCPMENNVPYLLAHLPLQVLEQSHGPHRKKKHKSKGHSFPTSLPLGHH